MKDLLTLKSLKLALEKLFPDRQRQALSERVSPVEAAILDLNQRQVR